MTDDEVLTHSLLPPLPMLPTLPDPTMILPFPNLPFLPAISKEIKNGVAHVLSAPFTLAGQMCTNCETAIKKM